MVAQSSAYKQYFKVHERPIGSPPWQAPWSTRKATKQDEGIEKLIVQDIVQHDNITLLQNDIANINQRLDILLDNMITYEGIEKLIAKHIDHKFNHTTHDDIKNEGIEKLIAKHIDHKINHTTHDDIKK